MVESDSLIVEESDSVVTIVFDRPDKRNAMDIDLISDLRDLLTELDAEQEQGILLTGNGSVTTAGADRDIVGGDDNERKRELLRGINKTYKLLTSYPRPTVMAAKGAAIGAGFQLALITDFTVVGEETALSKPEIKYGVFSGYSTAMLEKAAGGNVAREIALRGDEIPPERALEWGLVTDVVPEAEVEATARELAVQLADYEPTAYSKTKEALSFDGSLEEFDNYP